MSNSVANGIRVARPTPMTNAQIKAFPSTSFTLVSAAGANTIIRPIYIFANADFSSGGYSGVDTTYATLVAETNGQWAACPLLNDNTTTTPLTQLTSFMGNTDKVYEMPVPFMQSAGDGTSNAWVTGLTGFSTVADSVNQPLVMKFDNNGNTADLGGGHASNTLAFTVFYMVLAV